MDKIYKWTYEFIRLVMAGVVVPLKQFLKDVERRYPAERIGSLIFYLESTKSNFLKSENVIVVLVMWLAVTDQLEELVKQEAQMEADHQRDLSWEKQYPPDNLTRTPYWKEHEQDKSQDREP